MCELRQKVGRVPAPPPNLRGWLVTLGTFVLWATRRGFLNALPAVLVALALSGATPARADGTAPAPNAGQVPEHMKLVIEMAALALLALTVVHVAAAKRPTEVRQPQADAARILETAGPPTHATVTRKHPSLIALVALVVPTSLAGAESRPPDGESRPEIKHFTSGDKKIGVECFAPTATGKHPVLVTLHAVDGPDGAQQRMYHTAAREYVGKGYVVLLVHYFDRTGATAKDVEGYRELFREYFRRKGQTADELKRIKALSADWTDVVRDAVAYARGREDVDGERVGMVGFSLGATLALSAAARHDLKLAALVEFFGTLPRDQRASLKKLPPTLVVHGEDDQVVPVEEAYCLVGLLTVRESPHEVAVYRGADHLFFRDGKDLQALPLFLANRRTAAFLEKHLKPGDAATARK